MRRYYLGKLLLLTASLTAVVALTYPNVWAAGIISAQVILGVILVHLNHPKQRNDTTVDWVQITNKPLDAYLANVREHG